MGRVFGPPSIDGEIADWSKYGSSPQGSMMGSLMQKGDTQDAMGSLMRKYGGTSAADTLAGMAAGLIQASSPSPVPRSFVDILATGIGHGAQANIGSEDKILKRMMIGSQIETAQQKLKQQEAFQKILAGVGPTAPVAGTMPAGPAPGPVGYQPTLAMAEGGSGPSAATAVNPQSGAGGQYQFMPSTWADVAAKNPDLNLPPSPTQAPVELQAKAEERLRAQNGQELQKAGIQPTPANLYIAHRAGAQGAQTILNAPPETSMAQIVPASWIQQNPDMNTTVGQFRARAEQRFAQPPVQLAQAGNGPFPLPSGPGGGASMPQGAMPAPPAPQGPPQGAPLPSGMPQGPVPAIPTPQVPPGSQTLQDVVQKMPMGVRQLLGAMDIKEGLPVLMKYAEPNHQIAMDTRTGQVIFADKNDIGRLPYLVPVDAAKLQIEQQNANSQARQAAAREQANVIRGANEPMQPPAGPGLPPTPTPGFPEAKAAITGAEETAKVAPALLKYQGEEAIKDHQVAQGAAAKARASNANLTQLSNLLDGIDTGKFKTASTEAKAYMKGAGIDLQALGLKDDVAPIQAANKLLGQMALELRSTGDGGGMPGSMSDADRQFLVNMTPGVETTPEGRKLIVDYTKKLNQRTLDVANIKNDYVRSGQFAKDPAGMWAKVNDFVNSHPMFSASDMPAPASSGMPTMNAIDAEIERRRKK